MGGEIDNVLHEMSARGHAFLDDTLRFGRILEPFRQKRIEEDFARVVVADAPDRFDRAAQELIDWMVGQDLRFWRAVTKQVEQRRLAGGAERQAERLAGSFEYDRRPPLASLGQTAREVIQRHDHECETA